MLPWRSMMPDLITGYTNERARPREELAAVWEPGTGMRTVARYPSTFPFPLRSLFLSGMSLLRSRRQRLLRGCGDGSGEELYDGPGARRRQCPGCRYCFEAAYPLVIGEGAVLRHGDRRSFQQLSFVGESVTAADSSYVHARNGAYRAEALFRVSTTGHTVRWPVPTARFSRAQVPREGGNTCLPTSRRLADVDSFGGERILAPWMAATLVTRDSHHRNSYWTRNSEPQGAPDVRPAAQKAAKQIRQDVTHRLNRYLSCSTAAPEHIIYLIVIL